MPKITFIAEKNKPAIEVPVGANLMESLLQAGLPVASSCLGKGICSKCRIQIVSGLENLDRESELAQALRERNHVSNEYRISCQTLVNGDICIDTAYW